MAGADRYGRGGLVPMSVFLTKNAIDRKLCSLYLSIMDRMGVTLERFGDAETRLNRL